VFGGFYAHFGGSDFDLDFDLDRRLGNTEVRLCCDCFSDL